ncbi:hypothetical protein COK07_29355 [Bacillus thuringiensis]|uniref:hypothetical protein n=1 Tax=Bacillus thuringiensis TaxID=1428 RepID=UPI000BF3B11C|nr:hypothetical protein [Bacillus thuringiensis]PFI26732.1 hypothetical protein COI53_27035 [Bacillus thuringiensis]PFP70059.1 hypothetical protein COK07_29355 [Bacillus thuringiensis]
MLRMRMFHNESLTYLKEATITLTQRELNTLTVVLGNSTIQAIKDKNKYNLDIVEDFGQARRLYTKLTDQQIKKAGM